VILKRFAKFETERLMSLHDVVGAVVTENLLTSVVVSCLNLCYSTLVHAPTV